MTQDETDALSRRSFIAGAGAAGAVAIAGCTEQADTGGENANGDGNGGSTGSGSGNGQLSGNISISGSSTVYPLAEAVAEDFMEQHGDVQISVQSTGSGGGFSNFFCTGDTQFNNASRPIKESEEGLCEENGVEWHEVKVATDALTVIVNNENDWIDCATPEQLEQIWGPDAATKWSDVNSDWPDENIERYGPADTSGTFDYFSEEIMGEAGAHTSDYQPTEKDNIIVQGVTGSKYAIGYFGFSFYYNNPDQVTALAIDNGDGCVEPSLETAKSGEYAPLSRPLFTYPAKSALQEEHVAEFARYFVERSADEELVAETVGYVPNSQEEMQTQLDQLNEFIGSSE
ncbi:PstS family phosphate ABC transporter substrate-binding protein [Halobacteria archaeon HArc-gm2]|nr:PstS family phosphate ABC transporter substrate-binding protein [Halobacteria archaeon HArc-gm2]